MFHSKVHQIASCLMISTTSVVSQFVNDKTSNNLTWVCQGYKVGETIELIVESYHIAIKSARDVAASSINRKNLNAFYIF